MKQVFILIYKSDINHINSFFDRKEMTHTEAEHRNCDLKSMVWVLQPNS
jgi:hypothetical protein